MNWILKNPTQKVFLTTQASKVWNFFRFFSNPPPPRGWEMHQVQIFVNVLISLFYPKIRLLTPLHPLDYDNILFSKKLSLCSIRMFLDYFQIWRGDFRPLYSKYAKWGLNIAFKSASNKNSIVFNFQRKFLFYQNLDLHLFLGWVKITLDTQEIASS